jgi:DNA-binding NarL/FixJ family response regulator
VLVAEDQYLAREGTVRLLEARPEVEVVGAARDRDEVLDMARRLRPDVVLMDVKMPPTHTMEGIEAAHIIKGEFPGTGVVMLTQHDDEEYVWALLADGVDGYGYLHKVRVGDVETLLRALQEVAAGRSVIDPRILHTLLARRARKPSSALARLTPSELEVLGRMAEGRSNGAIAADLFVSVGTVEKRSAAIFSKLDVPEEPDVNRRVAAVLVYLRESGPGRPPAPAARP